MERGAVTDLFLHLLSKCPEIVTEIESYERLQSMDTIKVVYDASRRQGTAFVSINNPYYTAAEARALTFCTDCCRNNNAFSWLRWQPDRIDTGYSFCCTVDDFRRIVPHLPSFATTSLLS